MFSRQDKNFMKDPATAAARIYVGNLDQKVVEDDLRTLFSPYGQILGISVQRNFGFIQFESEANAALAIQKELGSVFKGKKLNVRGAITGEGGKGNHNLKNIPTTGAAATASHANNVECNNMNVDEPIQTGGGGVGVIGKDTPIKDNSNNMMYPRRGAVGVRSNNNNSYRDRSPLDQQQKHQHHYQQQQRSYNSTVSYRDQQHDNSRHLNDYQTSNLGAGNVHMQVINATTGPAGAAAAGSIGAAMLRKKIDCNDCEIIVVAKSLTEYAEYIEHKLKQFGITVDLLFPNEDVPIGRVLANIASRGCLYAILVTPQNEQHHSLTLNILYGAPEEHRNMPTDDAINLINKNFECYVRNDMGGGGNSNNIHNNNNMILNKLLIKHSDTIQILLNLLTQNRQLTTIQYEQLIKYLQERKQLQQQYEYETNNTHDNEDQDQQQANELQTRILNILNNTTTTTTNMDIDNVNDNNITNKEDVLNDIVTSVISKINNKTTTTTTETNNTTTATTPPPLLNDPSVQKALDSLLHADLLKNITINKQQQSNVTTTSIQQQQQHDNNHYGTNYSSNIRRF